MITFKEKPEKVQKTVTAVITVLLLCLAAVYFILLIGGRWIFGENSVFYRSLNPFSGAGDYVKWIRIISYGFFFITIGYLIRLFISWVLTFIKKGKAIFNLLSSFIKYLSVLIFIFASLRALNVDTGTLLAGIGILSLIVGLGAQPLIEDIISGLFIVFENVFDVGDIIIWYSSSVDAVHSEHIGIYAGDGNVWHCTSMLEDGVLLTPVAFIGNYEDSVLQYCRIYHMT